MKVTSKVNVVTLTKFFKLANEIAQWSGKNPSPKKKFRISLISVVLCIWIKVFVFYVTDHTNIFIMKNMYEITNCMIAETKIPQ